VRAYERMAYRNSELVLAVSDEDARAIRTLSGRQDGVRAIPISIDAGAVRPKASVTREPRLLFVGGLHWPPNLDAVLHFVRDVWPLVRKAVPSAKLTVVGRKDVPAARGIAATPGVTVAGYVDDIQPYFEASRAMVVPLRAGSGMRVKILDAFARGLPVVSTPTGHEGIDVRPGLHLLSAADAPRFAEAVLSVLADDRLAAGLATAARGLVEDRYDVSAVTRALLEAIATVRIGRADDSTTLGS
jgi:polysaccharide biosynthesis protein PslH